MRALAVLLVALVACTRSEPARKQPTAVKLAPVARATDSVKTRYSAQIVPAVEVKVAFKVGGYVESVARASGVDGKPRVIQEGDTIAKGSVLAALRKSDFVHEVEAARAERSRAGASARHARIELPRTQKLAESGAVAGAELDRAREQTAASGGALRGAQARLEAAKAALADATLEAPIDGVVLAKGVEVGELVAPGTIAFTIADISSVKVKFGVPDSMLPRIEMGATETITTDAYPGETFAGRVTLISPSADPNSRVFEVQITIDNSDGRLKVGSVASLALAAARDAELAKAPLVPISAIVRSPRDPAKFAVFVVEHRGGKPFAKAREVEVADYLGRTVPIKKGLAEGEEIVVQGAKLISDGEEVEVIH
jgi:multidrug efflux system membrane fusion protein